MKTRILTNRQKGATLIVALMFLVVLTLLGISAMSTTTVEERMARNSRDYNIAFQAAEAALRDAEQDILVKRALSGATGFSADCNPNNASFQGLCLPAVSPNPNVWDQYMTDTTRSVQYGAETAAPALPSVPQPGGVANQPRYLVEALPDTVGVSLKAGSTKYIYRITALGYGSNVNTQVWVQEVIRP